MSAAAQIPSPSTYIPSMSAAMATKLIRSPPTYRFRPKKRELIEFYLLPRARGQDPFPGVIFEDDAAGSTLPWDLFNRHGVGGEAEAYFVVRAGEARKPGSRQDRACDDGVGIWKMQSSVEKRLRLRGGERITVHVSNLSLHMRKGKSSSGSVGWVMHEYTIAAPPCPSHVKICHIAFSGHGRMRMRVPDGQRVHQSSGGHARVGVGATAASGSSALPSCSGAMLHQGGSLGVTYASGGEGPSHLVPIDDDNFRQSPLLGSSDFQGYPSAASEQSTELEAQVPTAEQQDIDIAVPQLMTQQSTMPVAQQVSARQLEFWSSIGIDVQSDISFDLEQSTGALSGLVAPNTSAMATGVQISPVVPNTSAMATGVQSSVVVPNSGAMATGVQSIRVVPNTTATATGAQISWVAPNTSAMVTGAQSSWGVPNTSTMATGVQSSWVAGDLDDFCRSVLQAKPTNCATRQVSNMATGMPGGFCSLLCK